MTTTTGPVRESATIYQFPARGRFAAERNDDANSNNQRYSKATFGAGWYHDDAIQEERAKKI
jgi:hypothetical protein